MSPFTTPGDDRERARERERYYDELSERARKEWLRLCPPGQVIDADHLTAMLRQSWGTHRPYLIARYFVIKGLRAAGVRSDFIADALGISVEKLREEEARSIYFSTKLRDDASDEERALAAQLEEAMSSRRTA